MATVGGGDFFFPVRMWLLVVARAPVDSPPLCTEQRYLDPVGYLQNKEENMTLCGDILAWGSLERGDLEGVDITKMHPIYEILKN